MNLTQSIVVMAKSVQVAQEDGSLVSSNKVRWRTYSRVHAVRGSERNQSSQTEAPALYNFWMHRNESLLEDDYIIWRGNQYNIRFIQDDGPPSVYMMIEAERGVAV